MCFLRVDGPGRLRLNGYILHPCVSLYPGSYDMYEGHSDNLGIFLFALRSRVSWSSCVRTCEQAVWCTLLIRKNGCGHTKR